MPVTILTKYSTTPTAVPNAGQLTLGELAINVTDKKIYALNASNNVVLLAQSPPTLTTTGTTGAATFTNNVLNIPQYQGAVTLTTTGTSGATTFTSNTLNVPQYQGAITFTTTGTSGASTFAANALNIPQYQGAITFTTIGIDGPATFAGNTLNIPQYQGALTVTSIGTSGPALLIGTVLNIPQYSGGAGGITLTTTGTSGPATLIAGNLNVPNYGGGAGTVSDVSVVSANGFAGTVATSTSTPAITLSTTITGVIKGNGTAISAATAGTDYLAPPSGTALLKANSGAALANAVAGTDYQAPITLTTTGLSGAATFTSNTLNVPNYGIKTLASTANSATPSINTDLYNTVVITGQTLAITSFTTNLTGTPFNGQKLSIAITGTTGIAITWGASFESSSVTLPTTTVGTNRLDIGFIWNVATSKWRCIGAA
jgi:hypothetical protein